MIKFTRTHTRESGLRRAQAFLVLVLGLFFALDGYAIDIVKVTSPQSVFDVRAKYKHEVLKRALDITSETYGPYEFQVTNARMPRSRAIREIQDGKSINLYMAMANEQWGKATIPVKIPLRLGILSYRLLLVHQATLEKFKSVKTIEGLKKLRVGLQTDWVIYKTFQDMGFDVVGGPSFDGTFLMLQYRRFDYMPRGIHEIYKELDARSEKIEDIVVEPTIALYLRAATYAYISPKYPRLAKRLETGLRQMVASGELRQILHKYYAADIEKADLASRKIIEIDNPFFKGKPVVNDKSLWYTPKGN